MLRYTGRVARIVLEDRCFDMYSSELCLLCHGEHLFLSKIPEQLLSAWYLSERVVVDLFLVGRLQS